MQHVQCMCHIVLVLSNFMLHLDVNLQNSSYLTPFVILLRYELSQL